MTGKRLRDVVVLASDLEAALSAWDRASGLRPAGAGPGGEGAARLVVGDVSISLVSPPPADRSLLEAMESRGEGLYALIIECEDLDGTVAQLRERGATVSDIETRTDGGRWAAIEEESTRGVPIRIVEKT